MTNGLSRRALAAGAAGLAAASVGPEFVGAKRKKKPSTVSLGISGRVTVNGNRVTIERVTHGMRVESDGSGGILGDPAQLAPPTGSSIAFHFSGFEDPSDRGSALPLYISMLATSGAYDPASGQLDLEGEITSMGGSATAAGTSRIIPNLALYSVAGIAVIPYGSPGS